ncbi:glycoside hydrolase family 25 protein [Marinoscillum sp.]|uniref:glycoside hydrolase family 25 protein n=1 Tax=Marinoscillum sp. TaxID=2024838 RepID=UPI003BADA758
MKTIQTILVLSGIIVASLSLNVYLWLSRGDGLKTDETGAKPESVTLQQAEKTLGCDLSHWDGNVDWHELKDSKVEFVFIKATQGSNYVDPMFEENWETSKNYGFIRGAYHFYQPGEDPKVQAAHFLSVVKHEKGDIVPVLDIEISHGEHPDELTKNISIWIRTVKSAIGRYPIIYTDRAFWNKAIGQDFSYCPLWLAEWEDAHAPYLPNGWKDWAFWQFSESGSVEGVSVETKVDLSHFNGAKSTLRNYQLN